MIKQNPYNSYYIYSLNDLSYHKETIDPTNFIQEIHYHIKNNEITKIEIFLKENLEELAKQHFFSINTKTNQKLTLTEIGISNNIAVDTEWDNNDKELKDLLHNHLHGLIFNLLEKQYKLQEDIKQSIKDNNVNKTFKLYTELQNIDIPDINSRDSLYGLLDNIPCKTLEFNQLPIETNYTTYVRKFA